MAKRDYEAIAKAIRDLHHLMEGTSNTALALSFWFDAVVEQLGQVFAADNPHYNHERFMKACNA